MDRPSIYVVDTRASWMNLSPGVPTVNVNLLEPDDTSLHTLQLSPIFLRFLAVWASAFGPSTRSRCVSYVITYGYPNVWWSVFNVCSVYKANIISSAVYLCMVRYFAIASGCRIPARLTNCSSIDISNALSTVFLIERIIGITSFNTKRPLSIMTANLLNRMCMTTMPVALFVPPMLEIARLSVDCMKCSRLTVWQ